jgi:hypothetical protein
VAFQITCVAQKPDSGADDDAPYVAGVKIAYDPQHDLLLRTDDICRADQFSRAPNLARTPVAITSARCFPQLHQRASIDIRDIRPGPISLHSFGWSRRLIFPRLLLVKVKVALPHFDCERNCTAARIHVVKR